MKKKNIHDFNVLNSDSHLTLWFSNPVNRKPLSIAILLTQRTSLCQKKHETAWTTARPYGFPNGSRFLWFTRFYFFQIWKQIISKKKKRTEEGEEEQKDDEAGAAPRSSNFFFFFFFCSSVSTTLISSLSLYFCLTLLWNLCYTWVLFLCFEFLLEVS